MRADRNPVGNGSAGRERGAALPLIAATIVVLIGLSALAIDLGWIYLNSSRVQRAADSAALAGVVFLPGDTAGVASSATSGANANGYDIGTVNGNPVGAGSGPDSLTWVALADNRLQVTLDSAIPTFFLKVLGFDSFDLSRTATAEYVKPVPLGSPDPCFGIGSATATGEDCSPATPQNFWAAISGPNTNKFNGDQYATRWWCETGCWGTPENDNNDYRPSGYYLGVEVPSGVGSLDIDIFDAAFWDRNDFEVQTGDNEQDSNGGADTHFEFYDWDTTPLDPTDNDPVAGCRFDLNSNTGGYNWQWRQLCSIANPPPGIYVVRIWTDGNDGGTNQYSVRATTSTGGDARVYGINDISIFNNLDGLSTLFLAEVIPDHAGKILEIDLYDPGEDDADAFMTVKMPNGSTADCVWEAFHENNTPQGGDSGPCRIQTSDGAALFNGQHLRIQIDIPDDYDCTTDCWWKMEIENSEPHDRTTWAARVIGNPVRLTPNT